MRASSAGAGPRGRRDTRRRPPVRSRSRRRARRRTMPVCARPSRRRRARASSESIVSAMTASMSTSAGSGGERQRPSKSGARFSMIARTASCPSWLSSPRRASAISSRARASRLWVSSGARHEALRLSDPERCLLRELGAVLDAGGHRARRRRRPHRRSRARAPPSASTNRDSSRNRIAASCPSNVGSVHVRPPSGDVPARR